MTICEQQFFDRLPSTLHTISQELCDMKMATITTSASVNDIATELRNLNANLKDLIAALSAKS